MTLTEIDTQYGREESRFLALAIAALHEAEEYDCVDNYRIAIVGDAESEAAYEEAQRQGCCGFVDVKLGPSPSGRSYLYGFNHGH